MFCSIIFLVEDFSLMSCICHYLRFGEETFCNFFSFF